MDATEELTNKLGPKQKRSERLCGDTTVRIGQPDEETRSPNLDSSKPDRDFFVF